MTTLAALKARIADDLERSDLSSQIADAINDAIRHYDSERFYFNETRALTFTTVIGQARYATGDDADIPKFGKLDAVYLTDSGGQVDELCREEPDTLEWLLDSSASTGEPYSYAYFETGFHVYPIPDAAYVIRPVGVVKKAAPATDDEANNVWMTEAFELLRSAAKVYIGTHVIVDQDLVARSAGAEARALRKLRAETGRKVGSGRIIPTSF